MDDVAEHDPAALARALDLADARAHMGAFCGVIEIPGAPVGEEDGRDLFAPIHQPPALHHRVLIDKLMLVEQGAIRRLMVFMPPGSAKSTYASVVFPAWFMGRAPKRNVILATYASDLARKMGRRARSIVKQPVYAEVFGGAGLSPESSAADEWALTTGSEYMSGGILAGITGNRADLLIVDDPIKGREEAESETIRKRTFEEYQDSLRTRLKPGGREVIIQTRWHEADLSGMLLPEGYSGQSGEVLCRDGVTAFVLNVPAQAEHADDPLKRVKGEYLWPEWFSEDHWLPFKQVPRTWSALFQQRPAPEDGTYFQRQWFKRFSEDQLPRGLRYYGTSDYAVTEGRGDWTVLRIWGVDHDMNVFLVDGWRGQTASDEWVEAQIDLIQRWRPRVWLGEAGVIQKAVEPMLLRRMRERTASCRLEWLPSVNDKATRARGFQDRCARGKVWIRDDAEGDFIISEYTAFPAGKHDDEVDNGSLLGRFLDQLQPARPVNRPAVADGTGEVW